jgi:two-component system sensor histidine kinase BaeS
LHFEALRLGKLVDDLYQLSLADSQDIALRKDPVKPWRILKETLESFRTQLAQRGIAIELDLEEDENTTIAGDAERLTQLFSNILENTLRYVDFPGTLRIRGNHTENLLTIYFEDSGPGVPRESLGRLFDRLYRVDRSRSRALGGSGLGLAICRQIVEGHGGRISADNSRSGGLSIRIEFPRISHISADNSRSGGLSIRIEFPRISR